MTSRPGYFADAQVPDMERRLASMVRIGTVEQLDEANARVRVKAGNVTTGWIPWTASRAGPDRQWSAPEKGEQVIVMAPSGDLSQGVVVGSIYRDAHPAPGSSRNVSVETWADGARQSYDRASHTHTLSVPSGGAVKITVGGTTWVLTDGGATLTTPTTTINGRVQINGAVTVNGVVTASTDVVGGGVSLVGHTHPGVERGGDSTDPPNAGGAGPGQPTAPVPGVANGRTFTSRTEPDGSRTVSFTDGGGSVRTDAHGNVIQTLNTLNGPVYYVQAQAPVDINVGGGNITTWQPVGDRVFVDAAGNPVSTVSYQLDNITIDDNGQAHLDPPVTVNQSIPAGDPLPGNQNKF